VLRKITVLFALLVGLAVATPNASALAYSCDGVTSPGWALCTFADQNVNNYMSYRPAAQYGIYTGGVWGRQTFCWHNSAWTNPHLRARCDMTWFYNNGTWMHVQFNVFNGASVTHWCAINNTTCIYVAPPEAEIPTEGNYGYKPDPNGGVSWYRVTRYGQLDEFGNW
jgi:hypothetical protein